jgi:hypothetical protein
MVHNDLTVLALLRLDSPLKTPPEGRAGGVFFMLAPVHR